MASDEEAAKLREVTDVRALRALAHPVRIALLEVLQLHGPMTATKAGELIGESPTTCSFHLRQLAKYHFVEEAGGGRGRERPWRTTSRGLNLPSSGDAETEFATATLMRLLRERQLARYREWLETRTVYSKEWQQAAGESELVFYLTAEELSALNDEMISWLLPRYQERLGDPATRPEGAVAVEMLILTYPIGPPSEEP
jgi:DNA-binding transcriptional ArsR family regulator